MAMHAQKRDTRDARRGRRERPTTRGSSALGLIGVGFSGTPESEAAVGLSGSIAVAAGADLRVLGVVEDRVAGLRSEDIVLAGDAIVARRLKSRPAPRRSVGGSYVIVLSCS